MSLGTHAFFIVSAYSAAVLIVAVLVAWVAFDYRRQTRALTELEARGVSRRSDRTGEVTP